MARMWLMAALLLLSASAGSSVENPDAKNWNKVSKPKKGPINTSAPQRPDEAQITQIVNDLKIRFIKDQRTLPMFSLAVSIPYNKKEKKYDVSEVTFDPKEVKDTILGCDVYISERMVAATVLKWPDVLEKCPNKLVPWQDVLERCDGGRDPNKLPRSMTWAQVKAQCPNEVTTKRADDPVVKKERADHAEYRVLQNFNTLKEKTNNKKDFLLFYVRASSCDQKCASTDHPSNILDSINVITKWANYAVVFSKVFKPKGGKPIPEENLKALKLLGTHEVHLRPIGLKNIYRCDGSVPCKSCSSGSGVTPDCYRDPQPAPNAASTSVNVPQGAKANFPHRGKNRMIVKDMDSCG